MSCVAEDVSPLASARQIVGDHPFLRVREEPDNKVGDLVTDRINDDQMFHDVFDDHVTDELDDSGVPVDDSYM